MKTVNPLKFMLMSSALCLTAMSSAMADSDQLMPIQTPQSYRQECAAYHIAYPPGLLPQSSWRQMMGNLEDHYGTDASLDDETVKQLTLWLESQAGTYKRVAEAPPENRITRSKWFVRKHREIRPDVWRLDSVKSAANCAACHTGAERGSFDDDNLKFPAGLDSRSRRAWND